MREFFLLLFFAPGLINAQVSLSPKIGFEYSGIAYFAKGAIKYNDVSVTLPNGEGILGVEIGLQKNKGKFSLALERMNLGEGVSVYNDSVVYPNNYVTNGSSKLITGRNILFLGFSYDKAYKKILNKRLTFFFGFGAGVGFNKNEAYYRETQDAGYSSAYFGGDNPVIIQRWAKPTGNGIFLKLRCGISLMNKKDKEIITVDFFWRHGVRKMVEYTTDYSYNYIGNPNSGHAVTNYRFNSRGTTFGSTLGFPIYVTKKPKK